MHGFEHSVSEAVEGNECWLKSVHLCVQIDMEERFCERVKQMGCTCVTISHRPALVAFHDLVLALDGEGGWAVHRGVSSGHAGEEDSLAGMQHLHHTDNLPIHPVISGLCCREGT